MGLDDIITILVENYFSDLVKTFSDNKISQKEFVKNILSIYNIDALNIDDTEEIIFVMKYIIDEDEIKYLNDFCKKIPNDLKTIFESPITYLVPRHEYNRYILDDKFINAWNNLSSEEKQISLQKNTLDVADVLLYTDVNVYDFFTNKNQLPLYLLEILGNKKKINLYIIEENLEKILYELNQRYKIISNVNEFKCRINTKFSSPVFYQKMNDKSFPIPQFHQIPIDCINKWKSLIEKDDDKNKYINALEWIIDNMDEDKLQYFMDRRYG